MPQIVKTLSSGYSNTMVGFLVIVPLENLELSERMGIILSILNSPPMLILLTTLLGTLSSMFRSRAMLELENLALRHQAGVLQRSARKRPRLTRRTAFYGSGCPACGATGVRLWPSSSQKRSWPGIVLAFAGSGLGGCGAANPDGPRFPTRSEA